MSGERPINQFPPSIREKFFDMITVLPKVTSAKSEYTLFNKGKKRVRADTEEDTITVET
jgi:hypothetical protein